MSLNIKNERVHQLAREAARRTGKTQTSAIEEALRRMLDDLDVKESAKERTAAILEIARDFSSRMSEEDRRNFTTDWLYDDKTGLPR